MLTEAWRILIAHVCPWPASSSAEYEIQNHQYNTFTLPPREYSHKTRTLLSYRLIMSSVWSEMRVRAYENSFFCDQIATVHNIRIIMHTNARCQWQKHTEWLKTIQDISCIHSKKKSRNHPAQKSKNNIQKIGRIVQQRSQQWNINILDIIS